ncbi:MAG: rod shape-determining protein MreD [Rhizomicrobium sp.]|jgi:rod shape-determining protein MreD
MNDHVVPMNRMLASITPFLFALVGVIVANLPVTFLGGLVPAPLFALMPVYFWCLMRPDLMPPYVVFAIGVLEDFFSGSPPGVWTLSFVAMYALVDRQRDAFAGLAGAAAVVGFGAATLVACGVAYLVAGFIFGHLPPVGNIAMEIAMTVVFYIPVLPLLNRLHHSLIGPSRSDF